MKNNIQNSDQIIYINNKVVQVTDWTISLLQQCELLNISIPRFCYHELLSIAGNCRMCLVEIKNVLKPVIACATSLTKGMHVFTHSELVIKARENIMEFLLINHPLDCPICDQGGECDLQDQTMVYGSDKGRFKEIKRSVEDKNLGPVVKTIMTRCIHCTRCIRFADELLKMPFLGTMGRGNDTEIGTYYSDYFLNELSGNIIDLCPVGALTSKPYAFRARPWELTSVKGIDILDPLGSFLQIDLKGNEVFRILPRRNGVINDQWISDKARFSFESFCFKRLVFPMMKFIDTYVLISWKLGFQILASKLNEDFILGKDVQFIIGDFIDLIDINILYYFTSLWGMNDISFARNEMSINMDYRYTWLLNNRINKLINSSNIIFFNCNPKLQCSVLNAKFNKSVSNNPIMVYHVGSFYPHSYWHVQIGINNNNFIKIIKGKNSICSKLINTKISLVSGMMNATDIYYFCSHYLENISYSYVAENLSVINSIEYGVNTFTKISANMRVLYIIGNTDIYENMKDPIHTYFSILQSTHFYDNSGIDLFLPIDSFYEKENIYLDSNLTMNHLEQVIDHTPTTKSLFNVFQVLNGLLTPSQTPSIEKIINLYFSVKIPSNVSHYQTTYKLSTRLNLSMYTINYYYNWNDANFSQNSELFANSPTLREITYNLKSSSIFGQY